MSGIIEIHPSEISNCISQIQSLQSEMARTIHPELPIGKNTGAAADELKNIFNALNATKSALSSLMASGITLLSAIRDDAIKAETSSSSLYK